ncbi:hypothetical protein, variant 5 [Aphanomyces astaci]|uniref:Serine aminopeptidase S33 domain-containing protein n=1 Tax=Aphanomyces astaci TaxID=112090 RepID=W4FKA4_APHAT|nr:hypothetical protein, variant 4 [Aphanomyces astaci]XP_009843307.1 hypothetical protein, variant 5 [Aphanomyces astaci]ETV67142.1 hypothetical protein, variant 4 [Aphanomyces astaci]ETV67143.1 hypothetical protein, variant 5 [Aphanomyces astaci]|eukprot:XP_009843306.1 hypothetical protein, variant 4 [Aphanomyces astaci]
MDVDENGSMIGATAVGVVAIAVLWTLWILRPNAHAPVEFIFHPSSVLHRRIVETGLTQAYVPPWYATNAHVQLFMFCLLPQVDVHTYDRELVAMEDGGQVALDWIASTLPPSAPIVLVLHTLAGCSQDMREFCHAATSSGYRAVVFNKRGHGQSKLTTPRLQAFGCTSDMKAVLAHVQSTFPGVPVVGVGYSAGAGLLSSYLGEMGQHSKLAAGVLVSPGYQHYMVHATSTSPSHFHAQGGLHPLYNYLMAKSLQVGTIPFYRTSIDICRPCWLRIMRCWRRISTYPQQTPLRVWRTLTKRYT